jgi:parvulin-like peptidyl-prolyl isomerase
MKIPALLALLFVLIFGCGKKKEAEVPKVASVGNDILTEEGFRATFTDEQWNSLTAEQKKKYATDWVNLTLLAQEADEQGLGSDPGVKQRVDYATKKVKANALIAQRLAAIQVSEDELFNYYRVHKAEFQSKLPEYHVQRIFVKNKATADGLLAELKNGMAFDVAVLSYSEEDVSQNFGSMGFITAAGPDSLFWRAARALKDKEPGLISTSKGWYVIRLAESREGTQDAGFEEYRDAIRDKILSERRQQVYDDLLRGIKSKHDDVYYY